MLKLSKTQKTALFAFLIVSFLAIILPQPALAISWNPFTWTLGDIGSGVFNAIVLAFLTIPLFLSAVFSDIAGVLLQLAVTLTTSGISYTKSEAVLIGWPIVRDFANIIIVLGFIVIGISTALRFKDYEAKKLLPKLIGIALLINFSLLICGIIIDGTNIITVFFFSRTGSANWFIPNILDSVNQLGNTFTDSWKVFGPKLIAMMLFNFFALFIYILYAILLLARVVALWILVILSPLAFVCWVFPATQDMWKMWWKNFTQWCIIGIPAGLFYYIGSAMISKIIATPKLSIASDSLLSVDTIKVLMSLFSLLLPGLFLIVGFFVSLQFSAMGASSILNYANKNKGKFMSGGMGALSRASDKAGSMLGNTRYGQAVDNLKNSNNWFKKAAGGILGAPVSGARYMGGSKERTDKLKSTAARALEGAGAIPPGTAAGAEEKRLTDATKGYAVALKSGNNQDKQNVFNTIRNGTGMMRAAAIQAAIDEGKLNDAFKDPTGTVDYNAMHNAITQAERAGARPSLRKDAEKKHYQLAEYGDASMNTALTALGHKATIDATLGPNAATATPAERMAAARSVLTPAQIHRAESKALYNQLLQNWGNMDTNARANVDLARFNFDDLEEFILSRNAEDIKAFRSLPTTHVNRGILKSPAVLGRVTTVAAAPGTSQNKRRRLDEVADEITAL
jgi:hypothetical protein